MAFLGDFGKTFLGGATTADVGGAIGGLFGQEKLGRTVGGTVSGVVSGVGDQLDTNPTPAGVDSAATLTGVSQTSQTRSPTVSVASQGYGMQPNQAFIGGPVGGAIVGTGIDLLSNLFRKPGVGGFVTGVGGGLIADFFIDQFGQQKKLVITRKMQRDVKKLFMMSGGNFNMTAELYRMATGRSITGEQVVKIITKTFKNQGPYVTKAAVRKTRSTIRKMETLCDLKDRLCPPKRRAPARRRTMSTSITQVK